MPWILDKILVRRLESLSHSSLLILLTCLNTRFAFMIDGNSKVYRFATNVAVLHVFLEANGTVHDYLNALAAIWAYEVNCFQ